MQTFENHESQLKDNDMPCADFEEIINRSVDGSVTDAERQSVDFHLTSCESCRQFRSELQALENDLARNIVAPRLSENFRPVLNERVRSTEKVQLLDEYQRKYTAEIAERQAFKQFRRAIFLRQFRIAFEVTIVAVLLAGAVIALRPLISVFEPLWVGLPWIDTLLSKRALPFLVGGCITAFGVWLYRRISDLMASVPV